MNELTEFSLSDMDENSNISGLEEHSLRVKVSLDHTASCYTYSSPTVFTREDHFSNRTPIKEESSFLPLKSMKRSSSITDTFPDPRPPRQRSLKSKNQSFAILSPKSSLNKTQTFTPSKSNQVPKPSPHISIRKRFEENFTKLSQELEFTEATTKGSFIKALHILGFIKVLEDSPEVSELFKLFSPSPSCESLKKILLGILGVQETTASKTLKEKFPGLYSNYFKSKRKSSIDSSIPSSTPKSSPRPSMVYKVFKHQEIVEENHPSVIEYLLSYQKTLESKLEKTTERVNKEKYKECTFKPSINKKSKHLDSTPQRRKNKNPYISLKEEMNAPRNETLYEFAEVSRHLKNESVQKFISEEASKFSYSPSVKILKSSENTPVKGVDNVVKRMQKARAEKEWKDSVMERGSTIGHKDKENCKKTFDLISEIEIKLSDGAVDMVRYCKGENIGFIVSEFCLKHKLRPEFHEKLVKIVLKSKGRETHSLF